MGIASNNLLGGNGEPMYELPFLRHSGFLISFLLGGAVL